MTKSNITIRCANCNRILSKEERPCPNYGSKKRHYSIDVGDGTITALASLKMKLRDSTGFIKLMSWARNKISRASKYPARESLTIDRSNPKFTRKLHHVEEAIERGEYKVVHHEDQKFPAKRRRRR